MNLEEYKKIIFETSSDDWNRICCWGYGAGPSYKNKETVWTKGNNEFHGIEIESHSEIMSLKSDLSITIAHGLTHNDDFKEAWANSFSDKHAASSFVDFFYFGQLIFRDIYVSVDGGRCSLPLPDLKYNEDTKEAIFHISSEKYNFFKIFNNYDLDYESYFQRTGIKLIDMPWMT